MRISKCGIAHRVIVVVLSIVWVGTAVGAVGGLGIILGGCSSLDEARQVREEVALLHAHLEDRADELAAAASLLDPADPHRPRAEALASSAKSTSNALGVSLKGLEAVLIESEHPSYPLTRTVQSIGPWLPEPIRVPAVLIAAAGTLAWRSSRLKQGLRSVVLSIEAAKRSDEEFRQCFSRHTETFRAAQTPAAQRLVRRITEPALPA